MKLQKSHLETAKESHGNATCTYHQMLYLNCAAPLLRRGLEYRVEFLAQRHTQEEGRKTVRTLANLLSYWPIRCGRGLLRWCHKSTFVFFVVFLLWPTCLYCMHPVGFSRYSSGLRIPYPSQENFSPVAEGGCVQMSSATRWWLLTLLSATSEECDGCFIFGKPSESCSFPVKCSLRA